MKNCNKYYLELPITTVTSTLKATATSYYDGFSLITTK